ncbi:MAG: histidine phosphatase family protein [Propioniciclava sp.]
MTDATTRLILLRHGQTDANAGGRFQGHQDVPLNRVGRSQAEAAGERLSAYNPARVISSDLDRAVSTARPLADRVGVPVITDERLREINVGSWQGMTGADIAEANPWFTEALAQGRDFRRSASGETATEAGERIAAVLTEVADEHPGETSVIVGHGLALRVGMALWLGMGFDASFVLTGLWNGSWSILTQDERRRLQSYNVVAAAQG